MTLSKIIILLVTIPFLSWASCLACFYHSFCAGMLYAEKLIEKSIKP